MPALNTIPTKEIARTLCDTTTNNTSIPRTANLSTDTTEQVAPLLLDIYVREQQKQNWLRWCCCILVVLLGVGGGMLGTAAAGLALHGKPWAHLWRDSSHQFRDSFVVAWLLWQVFPVNKRQKNAAQALVGIAPQDFRTLIALLDTIPIYPVLPGISLLMYFFGDHADILRLLTPLLWNAEKDGALVLSETRRKRLRGMLNLFCDMEKDLTTEQADFCTAAMKVLTLVGDTRSIALFKRIAATQKSGASRAFLASFAVDCLSLLQVHAEKNKAAQQALPELLKGRRGNLDQHALLAWIQNNDVVSVKEAFRLYLERNLLRLNSIEVVSSVVALALYVVAAQFIYKWMEARSFSVFWKYALFLLLPGRADAVRKFFTSRLFPSTEGIAYTAQKIADVKLLPALIDMARLTRSRILLEAIADELRCLKPGDIIYFAPRHLSFLRSVVWRKTPLYSANEGTIRLVSSAIYALGVLGDTRATRILTRIAQSKNVTNIPLHAEIGDALRRINDTKEWRDGFARGKH